MDQIKEDKLIIDLSNSEVKVYGGKRKIALYGKNNKERAMNLICQLPVDIGEEIYNIFRIEYVQKKIENNIEFKNKLEISESEDIIARVAEQYVEGYEEFSEDFEVKIVSVSYLKCCIKMEVVLM